MTSARDTAYLEVTGTCESFERCSSSFFITLNGYLLGEKVSRAMVGQKFQASNFDPSVYCASQGRVGSVRVLTTRLDDILGCGEQNGFDLAPRYLGRRFGAMKSQKTNFAHEGTELPRAQDFSATLTQQKFT